jgi:hypothetical protein
MSYRNLSIFRKAFGSFFTQKRGIVKALFFTITLLVSSPAFAETFEIYTYGGGDFLYYVLNGVAMIFQTNIIKSLVYIAAMLLLLSLVSRLLYSSRTQGSIYNGEGFLDMLKITLFTLMAVEVFTVPKADVLIVDRSKPSQTQLVQNVPYVQAFTMHASSLMGDYIGEVMEDVFALPDSIKFRNNGVALGAKYTSEFMGVYPPDTTYAGVVSNYRTNLIYTTLREFFMTCVFTELSNPNLDNVTAGAYNALFSSTNILEDPNIAQLSDTVNKVITGLKNNEPTMTCRDALTNIGAAWNDSYDKWVEDIAKTIGGRTGDEVAELWMPRDYLEQVFNYYFPPGPLSSKQTMMNIAVINTMKDAMLVYVSQTQNSASLAEYLSKKKTTAGWITGARMLNHIIVILRQVFEGLIYGLSIFLPFAVVLGGGRAFSIYVKLVFWLNLWVPFYILLNLLVDVRYRDAVNSLAKLADGSVGATFRNYEEIQEQANIVLGIVGATTWIVPSLAWGLISGAAHGISSAMHSLTSKGSAGSTAYQTGSEVYGGGNVSVGNRSIGNEGIRTTDAVSSAGSRTGNWANSMAVTGAVSSIGLPAAVNAMENNLAHTWGAGTGYQNKSSAFSTGVIQTQQQTGIATAIQDVADTHFAGNVSDMGKNFASMGLNQQASVISGVARQMGISPDMASVVAGDLAGTKGMTELMSFGGKLNNFSTDELIKAGAGKGTIEAAQTLSSLAYMEQQGMSPENFGDKKGMLDTAKAIGDIGGFESAYDLAKAGGYEGSPGDFMSLMREMGYSKGFAESSKLQDIAQKHFGGNEQAMFGAFAAMQYGKTAGAVKKAGQHGWTPDTLSEYMGHIDALSGIGKAGGYKLLGDQTFMQTEQGKVLNESARFEMLRTAATQGGFAGPDGNVSGAEMYNFLQHHNGSIGAVLGDEQAKLFGHDKGGRFNLSMTPDGNVVATEATRGSMDNTYDVNKLIISGGTEIDRGTAFQMALNGDSKLVGQVTNPYLSGGAKDSEVAVLSRSLGLAASDYISRQGVSVDYSRGNVGISGGIGGNALFFKGGVEASGSTGGERRDQKATDLMIQGYDSLIRNSLNEASKKGLSTNETRELLRQNISDYSNAIYSEVRKNSPDKFGSYLPVHIASEAIDAGKPLPFASKEEQQRRLEKLNSVGKSFRQD